MDQASLKKVYEWFDRLIDLSPDVESQELQSLRERQEPWVLHLECLLASARKNTNTTVAFGIKDLVTAARIASDAEALSDSLDQLAKELKVDQEHKVNRVGSFLLRRCLSVSKLGITYYAYDLILDREVVVLLAMPKWRSSATHRGMIVESARVVAKLFHPNVASILGTLDADGQFLTLRQWIPGISLQESHESRGVFDFPEAVNLAIGITSGLQALHQNGILHGDLKPANIILREENDSPVITDFGTSLWIGDSPVMAWKGGTPGYIAPEILEGAASTKSADLFSLGVILFQICHPESLFKDSLPPLDTRWAGDSANPDNQNLRNRFQTLVDSLLTEEPTKRISSVQEVLSVLTSIQESLRESSNPSSKSHRNGNSVDGKHSNKLSRRRWLGYGVEYSSLGAISTGLGYFGAKTWNAKPESKPSYVPGIETKHHLYFPWDQASESAKKVSSLRFPPSELCDTDFVGVKPILSHEWIYLDTELVQLPEFQSKANLIMFGARFDLPPGNARIQLAYRYRNESRWNGILDAKNTFGGLYFRHFQTSVPNSVFRPSVFLQFRIAVRTEISTKGQTDSVPVAINTHQDKTDRAMVQLRLWDRLTKDPQDGERIDA